MANSNSMEIVQLNNVDITTANYDKNSKYTREVQRKSAYITANESELKKLADFGVSIYTPKDADYSFAIIPFSASTKLLYEDLKQSEKVIFDDKLQNYSFENVDIVVSKSTSEQGQVMYRVLAVRTPKVANIQPLQAVYFEDDQIDYQDVSSSDGKPTLLGGDGSMSGELLDAPGVVY